MPHAQGGSDSEEAAVGRPCVLACAVSLRTETLLCLQPRTKLVALSPSTHYPLQFCSWQHLLKAPRNPNGKSVAILTICSLPCRQQRVRRRIVGHPPSFPVSHQPSQVARVEASRLLSHIYYTISFRAASSALPQKNIFIITVRQPHFCSIAPEFWFAIIRIA